MNNGFSRRDFFNLFNRILAVTGLAAIFGPIVAFFYPPNLVETPSEPVFVAPETEFPKGTSKTVKFGRYPAIIINSNSGIKAYSAVCTHFACIVMWDPETYQIACPCHDGFFNPEDGSVISGPPPSPLDQLNIDIIDGEIYVRAGDEA